MQGSGLNFNISSSNSYCQFLCRRDLDEKIRGCTKDPCESVLPSQSTNDGGASFDIVLFHGLQIGGGTAAQEAYRRTWTNKDNVLWPKEWLPNDLENIRVFSLSYDAEATKWFGEGNTEDVEYIGENLFQSLVM